MYRRIGLPKNSSHAAIGLLEFFLRCAFTDLSVRV
jgi:hypothetical protein